MTKKGLLAAMGDLVSKEQEACPPLHKTEVFNMRLTETKARQRLNKAFKDGSNSRPLIRIGSLKNSNISSSNSNRNHREPQAPAGIIRGRALQQGKLYHNTSCRQRSLAWRELEGKTQLYDSTYM